MTDTLDELKASYCPSQAHEELKASCCKGRKTIQEGLFSRNGFGCNRSSFLATDLLGQPFQDLVILLHCRHPGLQSLMSQLHLLIELRRGCSFVELLLCFCEQRIGFLQQLLTLCQNVVAFFHLSFDSGEDVAFTVSKACISMTWGCLFSKTRLEV